LFGEEFSNFCEEFYKFVKEHREKIENETGIDITDVGVLIHDKDLNVIYEGE